MTTDTQPSSTNSTNSKVVAGAVVAVLGVGFLGYEVYTGIPTDTGCTMTATGVTAIAVGLSHGHTSQEILSMAGGTLAGAGCKQVVDHWVKGEKSDVDVQGADGTKQTRTLSPEDITRPAPSPTTVPAGSERWVKCIGWQTRLAYDFCVEGILPYPAVARPASVSR